MAIATLVPDGDSGPEEVHGDDVEDDLTHGIAAENMETALHPIA